MQHSSEQNLPSLPQMPHTLSYPEPNKIPASPSLPHHSRPSPMNPQWLSRTHHPSHLPFASSYNTSCINPSLRPTPLWYFHSKNTRQYTPPHAANRSSVVVNLPQKSSHESFLLSRYKSYFSYSTYC